MLLSIFFHLRQSKKFIVIYSYSRRTLVLLYLRCKQNIKEHRQNGTNVLTM
nr:MAG TPA: hypothetical protein [Caudoviricetes sp.]